MALRDALFLLSPPVAAATAAPLASLHVLPGATINPHLFGYDLEEWGSPLNLTYNDTAGLALTQALRPGVLRYPSGTGSNIWIRCVAGLSQLRLAMAEGTVGG